MITVLLCILGLLPLNKWTAAVELLEKCVLVSAQVLLTSIKDKVELQLLGMSFVLHLCWWSKYWIILSIVYYSLLLQSIHSIVDIFLKNRNVEASQLKCVTCNHCASMQTQPLLHQTMFSPHISCLPALYKVQTSLSSGTCFFKWHQIANGFFRSWNCGACMIPRWRFGSH